MCILFVYVRLSLCSSIYQLPIYHLGHYFLVINYLHAFSFLYRNMEHSSLQLVKLVFFYIKICIKGLHFLISRLGTSWSWKIHELSLIGNNQSIHWILNQCYQYNLYQLQSLHRYPAHIIGQLVSFSCFKFVFLFSFFLCISWLFSLRLS